MQDVDKMLFGYWDTNKAERTIGALERLSSVELVLKNQDVVLANIQKKARQADQRTLIVAGMSLLSSLQALGVNTKDLIPTIIKLSISTLGFIHIPK